MRVVTFLRIIYLLDACHLLETEECHAVAQNGTVICSIISLANVLTFVQSVTLHTTHGDLKVCL
jgi:hypothetical protein